LLNKGLIYFDLLFDKRKKGTKSLLLIIILYGMQTLKEKLNKYILIVALSVLLGLLSYPFHKSDDFLLFKNLPDLDNFKIELDIANVDFKDCEMVKTIKKNINFIELEALINLDCVNIIDARSASEIYDEKIDDKSMMIQNAINIPLSNIEIIESEGYFDDKDDLDKIKEIELMYESEFESVKILNDMPRDGVFVIYCGSKNCDKSENLANYMFDYFDYQNVSIYKGGWEDWRNNAIN
tara:strand:- start:63 stop:776 length:714 start_codon:yes stop_codon:yes gene_type:complete